MGHPFGFQQNGTDECSFPVGGTDESLVMPDIESMVDGFLLIATQGLVDEEDAYHLVNHLFRSCVDYQLT